MTLKVWILRCLRRLFIILVSLAMTWFGEKMITSTRCTHGFMSNLIKNLGQTLTNPVQIEINHHWMWYDYQQPLNWLYYFSLIMLITLIFKSQIRILLMKHRNKEKFRTLRWNSLKHFYHSRWTEPWLANALCCCLPYLDLKKTINQILAEFLSNWHFKRLILFDWIQVCGHGMRVRLMNFLVTGLD